MMQWWQRHDGHPVGESSRKVKITKTMLGKAAGGRGWISWTQDLSDGDQRVLGQQLDRYGPVAAAIASSVTAKAVKQRLMAAGVDDRWSQDFSRNKGVDRCVTQAAVEAVRLLDEVDNAGNPETIAVQAIERAMLIEVDRAAEDYAEMQQLADLDWVAAVARATRQAAGLGLSPGPRDPADLRVSFQVEVVDRRQRNHTGQRYTQVMADRFALVKVVDPQHFASCLPDHLRDVVSSFEEFFSTGPQQDVASEVWQRLRTVLLDTFLGLPVHTHLSDLEAGALIDYFRKLSGVERKEANQRKARQRHRDAQIAKRRPRFGVGDFSEPEKEVIFGSAQPLAHAWASDDPVGSIVQELARQVEQLSVNVLDNEDRFFAGQWVTRQLADRLRAKQSEDEARRLFGLDGDHTDVESIPVIGEYVDFCCEEHPRRWRMRRHGVVVLFAALEYTLDTAGLRPLSGRIDHTYVHDEILRRDHVCLAHEAAGHLSSGPASLQARYSRDRLAQDLATTCPSRFDPLDRFTAWCREIQEPLDATAAQHGASELQSALRKAIDGRRHRLFERDPASCGPLCSWGGCPRRPG